MGTLILFLFFTLSTCFERTNLLRRRPEFFYWKLDTDPRENYLHPNRYAMGNWLSGLFLGGDVTDQLSLEYENNKREKRAEAEVLEPGDDDETDHQHKKRKTRKKQFPQSFKDIIRHLKAEDAESALNSYYQFRDEVGIKRVPAYVYNGILNLCGTTALVDQGRAILEEMRGAGIKPEENSLKFLVDEACERRDIPGAMSHVRSIVEAGMTPKLRLYSQIIKILSEEHRVDEILEVWEHMHSYNVEAKEEQYLQMIDCFGGAGVLFRKSNTQSWYREWADLLFGSLKEKVFGLNDHSLEILKHRFSETAVAGTNVPPAVNAPISEEGICSHCQGQLQAVGLSPSERKQVRDALLQIAAEQPQGEVQVEYFRNFIVWLEKRLPYDYIIDAANVAYASQNVEGGYFNHYQVNLVVKALEGKGHRVLILIPERYMKDTIPNSTRYRQAKKSEVSGECKLIMKEWQDKGDIYIVPDQANDDWYWMYASVAFDASPAMVISNDMMRDHRLALLASRPFYRWRNTQIVGYGFKWPEDEVKRNDILDFSFHFPPVFSSEIQKTANGAWHFPSSQPENKEWLCLHVNSVIVQT